MSPRKGAQRPAGEPVPASWAGRSPVVLRGGPRDGSWYFAEDLRTATTAGPSDPRSVAYGYEPTTDTERNPVFDAVGTVWRYTYPPGAVHAPPAASDPYPDDAPDDDDGG